MLDRLISIIAPHECLVCNNEGLLLCKKCSDALPSLPERCYKCSAISPDNETCRKCLKTTSLYVVQAATIYSGAAKDLVWKLKFAHARAAADPMVALMTRRIVFDASTVFVPVPTATSRVRQRGYDQAELLCRQLSNKTGIPYRFILTRHGQSRQVGTGKTDRIKHLSGAFKIRNRAPVAGKHVVLIDDVLTTGATLEAAARVMKKAGASRVDAIVFAQA